MPATSPSSFSHPHPPCSPPLLFAQVVLSPSKARPHLLHCSGQKLLPLPSTGRPAVQPLRLLDKAWDNPRSFSREGAALRCLEEHGTCSHIN